MKAMLQMRKMGPIQNLVGMLPGVPKELRDAKVSMQVMLLEGGRPLVDTAVALRDHGVLLVGGPKQQEGVLIISIGADTE